MRILITGAGSGIGRALSILLTEKRECTVLAVGRRFELLSTLQKQNIKKIEVVQADISAEFDRSRIVEKVKEGPPLTHIIHNAATIYPISPIAGIQLEDFRLQQATNTEAPFFLTQKLLPFMAPGCRVLFVSSGSALIPSKGLSSYCISKSALEMVCRAYQVEFKDENLYFASIRPGEAQSQITEALSRTPAKIFPMSEMIKQKMIHGMLPPPETAAQFIAWVLFDTSSVEYEKHWTIQETSLYQVA